MSQPIPPPPAELVELMEQPFAPQRAFRFNRDKWLEKMQNIDGAAEAINSLPDYVDRAIIRQAVRDLEDDNIVGAFITVMIWGHGLVNYGPHRTLRVLTDDFTTNGTLSDDVATKIRQSCTVSREQGNEAGFYYLNNEGKMRKLGASFFTKWLYYVTATGPQGEDGAAPVLDEKVIAWFQDEVGEKLKYGRTKPYKRYVQIVTTWGSPYDLTAVDVEERIFRLIRDDGAE